MPGRFRSLAMAIAIALCVMTVPVPGSAQVQVGTVEELRGKLAPKDVVSLVQVSGDIVTGQLVRFGDIDLEVRAATPRSGGQPRRFQTRTIPHGTIRSIERLPDSSRNGALIGAGVGAGVSLAMFLRAVAVDRNEMDEWAAGYLLMGGIYTGVGALVGWIADAVHSKPRIRFDLTPTEPTGVPTVLPPAPGPQIGPRPRVAPDRPPAGQTPVPSVPPAVPRPARRVVVGTGFGWGNGLMPNRAIGSAYPNGIPGHVAPRTTAMSVAAGVELGRKLSVRGEATWHSPSAVTDEFMELETGTGLFLPLSDWPSQTFGDERVRWTSWEQRFPYSFSGFVGYHLSTSRLRRIDPTLLVGLTLSTHQDDYVEQHYTVVGGVPVPQPTFGVVGGPYTRQGTRIRGALAMGLDAKVALTDHLAVVPNVRLDLFASNWARARGGAGIQWTF